MYGYYLLKYIYGVKQIKKILHLIPFLVLTMSVVSLSQVTVHFPDTSLHAAIVHALRTNTSEITKNDVESLTSLVAAKRGIKKLNGLEYCINIENLNLWGNQINNLSCLSKLTKLQSLILGRNQIKNIRPLAKLVNLTNLNLRENQVVDISSLAKMAKMKTLEIRTNNIKDVSALAGMRELEALNMAGNNTNNISALSELTNLTQTDRLRKF